MAPDPKPLPSGTRAAVHSSSEDGKFSGSHLCLAVTDIPLRSTATRQPVSSAPTHTAINPTVTTVSPPSPSPALSREDKRVSAKEIVNNLAKEGSDHDSAKGLGLGTAQAAPAAAASPSGTLPLNQGIDPLSQVCARPDVQSICTFYRLPSRRRCGSKAVVPKFVSAYQYF